MFKAGGLFLINSSNAGVLHQNHVVAQLRAQAQGIDVVVISACVGLVSLAAVECLRFAVGGIAPPDSVAVSSPASAGRPALRIEGRYGRKDSQKQHGTDFHCSLSIPIKARDCKESMWAGGRIVQFV